MARFKGTAVWETRLLGILATALALFGIAAVYGASSIWAVQAGNPGSDFALRQAEGVLVGVVAMLIVSRIDYHYWRKFAWPLLLVASVALLILLLPFTHAIAPERNGARRWIEAGFRIQPSELAKFVVVVWTAMLAAKKGDKIRHLKKGVFPFLVMLVPIVGLVVLEPDLSTGVTIMAIAGAILFVAGARIGHFLLLGLVALPLLWQQIVTVQYRMARLVGFLSSGGDLEEASWQIRQSMIGIGAGRLFGVGFGEGMQKLGYLPYAYADFIFSTIGEEWGFVGVSVLLALFAIFLVLGFRIAREAPDPFGMYVATGLTVMLGLAVVLHVGVNLNVVPATGISLPFLSYGRSGLVVAFLATGVLLNIARQGREAPLR